MLRASLLVMTYAAARLGDADLATMQLALTIWTFLAFTLDAVAIAAQAITGRYLGAGDVPRHPCRDRPDGALGLVSGIVTGLALAAVRRSSARCSRATPWCRTCWSRCCSSPRSRSRSPASCSSSTAC